MKALEMHPGTVLPNGAVVIAASARDAHEWILLCLNTPGEFMPYVTWRCTRPGDGSDTVWGNYHDDLESALADFKRRR
jgi:hypothetical protein